jgi:hypothetical protein
VNREKMANPSVEMIVAGVQNRRILSGLLVSRLAEKNKAKSERARIQNSGETRPSKQPPMTAATPVAFELLIPLKAATNPGPSSAATIAATALRAARRVVTVFPLIAAHISYASLDG